jgi:MFS family permease
MKVTEVTVPPARVVRNYLVISGTFTLSASVIWGVNTLFLLHAGLSIAEVFLVNSAFTVGTIFCEIPTGVVADTSGRRRSFLLSTAILTIGTVRGGGRQRPRWGHDDRAQTTGPVSPASRR